MDAGHRPAVGAVNAVAILAAVSACLLWWWPPQRSRAILAGEPDLVSESSQPLLATPELILLIRLALLSGQTVGQTIATIAETWPHPIFVASVERLRHGHPLAVAVADWPEPDASRVADLLLTAATDGLAVGAALDQASELARADRRRRAETAARQGSVLQLFPLVLCIFPAFVALAVAPMVAGSLQSLASAW